jgi:hypothetical protein
MFLSFLIYICLTTLTNSNGPRIDQEGARALWGVHPMSAWAEILHWLIQIWVVVAS